MAYNLYSIIIYNPMVNKLAHVDKSGLVSVHFSEMFLHFVVRLLRSSLLAALKNAKKFIHAGLFISQNIFIAYFGK